MAADNKQRESRKVRVGSVISDKMDKSIVVRINRTITHPRYKKIFRTYSKLYAHDETNQAGVGDVVRVMETRPLSAKKRWRLVDIIEKAK